MIFVFLADVLTEEVILKWYKEGHSKGKTTFLEQMKKFIEWLQNAEEGNNIIIILNLPPSILVISFTVNCEESNA